MPDSWERHKIVIAAAVAAAAGPCARILGIKPARGPLKGSWTRQGRQNAIQMASGLANRRGSSRTLPDRGVNR